MRHIKLTLEYDGTGYSGWQSQTNGIAIQDVVSRAIEKMVEEKISLRGASRTDAGVHALGQVATFQTGREISCDGFLKGLNSLLPDTIRVLKCEEVPLAFHPIKDAKRKHYQYVLEIGEVPSALCRNRAWWVGPRLDIAVMKEASNCLIGEHDFRSFRGALSNTKTSVRRMETISLQNVPGTFCNVLTECDRHFLSICFTANGFLKYMVRNMVGTFVEIGLGKRPSTDMKKVLGAKNRKDAGPTAPPRGLYLLKVDYFFAGAAGGGGGGV